MLNSPNRFFDNKKWVYAILLLAPALLYLKSLFYDFSPMDDQWLIVKNYRYLHQWDNIVNCFKEPFSVVYYRPLVTVSFIIESHLGKLNPSVFHFTNLLIHLACVLVLYHLLLLFNVRQQIAFMLSLIFSVHPVLLHGVAWIPGRNDAMLCLFTLASALFLAKYLIENKKLHFFLHFIFFIMALFTKESAILLPLVFISVYACYRPLTKKLLPIIATWFVFVFLWYMLKTNVVNNSFKSGSDMSVNIRNFFSGLIMFIGKAIIPVQQSVAPTLKNTSLLPGIFALIAILVSYFTIGVQSKRLAGVGITLFITMLIIPVWFGANSTLGEQYEQRIYASLAGLIIFIGQLNFNANSKIIKIIFPSFFVLFAAKTFYRMDLYKNADSFITAGVNECPDNYAFYFQKGNSLFNKRDFNSALGMYSKAIELNPNRAELYNNRGDVYAELKKKDQAIADYSKAMMLTNNSPVIYLKRCVAFYKFGDIEGAMHDLEGLKKCCRKYIPEGLESTLRQSWADYVLITLNNRIAAEPRNALLYVNRAKCYMERRLGAQALADLKKACELEPGNKEFRSYYDQLNSTFPHK